MSENKVKQRDRPRVGYALIRLGHGLARLWGRWGANLLLMGGAAALTVGAALIHPPAGWIAGGVMAILGGVLSALGGGDDK